MKSGWKMAALNSTHLTAFCVAPSQAKALILLAVILEFILMIYECVLKNEQVQGTRLDLLEMINF